MLEPKKKNYILKSGKTVKNLNQYGAAEAVTMAFLFFHCASSPRYSKINTWYGPTVRKGHIGPKICFGVVCWKK